MIEQSQFCIRFLSTLTILFASSLAVYAEQPGPYVVDSPNGAIEVEFSLRDGAPVYSVTRAGTELIRESRLGFKLVDAPPLDGNFAVASVDRDTTNETWIQPWGEKKEIRNSYHELRILLRQQDRACSRAGRGIPGVRRWRRLSL